MTNKFLRHDGIQWNLDQGLLGPPGPPGPPGPAGSGGGSSALIYRPGGTQAGSVFTSWTDLMAKRVTSEGPLTIVVDDSIVSPALIDVGTWDLTHNTPLVGANGHSLTDDSATSVQLTQLHIPDGAQLFNAIRFEDLHLTGHNNTFPCIDSDLTITGTTHLVIVNCLLRNDNAVSKPLINTIGGFVDLYGDTHFVTNFSTFVLSGQTTNGDPKDVTINLYDNSRVDGYTLFFQDGTYTLTVNVNSSGAFYDVNQPGVGITTTINGENLTTGFDTAANGSLPYKSNAAQTTWGPPSGLPLGDIGGVYPNLFVQQITGDGNNVDIACPVTTFNAPGQPNFHPQTIQSSFLNAPNSFSQNVYNLPVSSGVQVDVIATALHDATGDFASWKISLGAYSDSGGTTIGVGSNPNPLGVTPDRATPGALGWVYTLAISGSSINSQGTAATNTRWGITYQIIPLLGP